MLLWNNVGLFRNGFVSILRQCRKWGYALYKIKCDDLFNYNETCQKKF